MQQFLGRLLVLGLIITLVRGVVPPSTKQAYLQQEFDFLAPLHDRLTGSPKHDLLVDRIQSQLEALGLTVQTDRLEFVYYDGPLSEPKITVGDGTGDVDVPVTSYSKYSGFTTAEGVEGKLVDLRTSSLSEMPGWEQAEGAIAVTNITNVPANYSEILDVWPARKGASSGLLEGEWVPFHALYQGVPTVFVQGMHGQLDALVSAAERGASAKTTLEATMRPHTPARTLYTIIPGTDLANESMILNTHTDGTNIIEENGYIALLSYAAHLAAHPPRRTTILVFVGQHMHYESFTQGPYKATSRWLNDHPDLWAGAGNRWAWAKRLGGQMKAVVGSCVEHLGAVHWDEDVASDKWFSTHTQEPELLYASTSELNGLLREHWKEADVNTTRVTDPVNSKIPPAGEGYPFYLNAIPNLSLVTNPNYLLKIWSESFDERALVDVSAVQRQIESFMSIWQIMDGMGAEGFGVQSKSGRNRELHV